MEAQRSKGARKSEESNVHDGQQPSPRRQEGRRCPTGLVGRPEGGEGRRLGPIFSPLIPNCLIFWGLRDPLGGKKLV